MRHVCPSPPSHSCFRRKASLRAPTAVPPLDFRISSTHTPGDQFFYCRGASSSQMLPSPGTARLVLQAVACCAARHALWTRKQRQAPPRVADLLYSPEPARPEPCLHSPLNQSARQPVCIRCFTPTVCSAANPRPPSVTLGLANSRPLGTLRDLRDLDVRHSLETDFISC